MKRSKKRLNAVGPRVKKLRLKRRWSQAKLAKAMQAHGWNRGPSTVSQLENQARQVFDFELVMISQALEVTIDELFLHPKG